MTTNRHRLNVIAAGKYRRGKIQPRLVVTSGGDKGHCLACVLQAKIQG